MPRVAAVDLGASSGRVSAVEIGETTLRATCVHRFDTAPVLLDGRLVWDIVRIQTDIETGLADAAASGRIDAVGVDAWGCDYGLVSPEGTLTELPACYRDARTQQPDDRGASAIDRVHATVRPDELYATTGSQFQPFTTVYQLADDIGRGRLAHGEAALMIPDLVDFWLTGLRSAEVTNLSTTGLVDPRTRRLAEHLIERLADGPARCAWTSLGRQWRAPVEPGAIIGPITGAVAAHTGLRPGTPVVAVASHDTASAVAAVPADDAWAYVVSGTWSLVGMELDRPVLTPASRAANFTNELGVAGTVRFLRNVTGLWVLTQCLRSWQVDDPGMGLTGLLTGAAAEPGGALFDIDDPGLLPPGLDMPRRVARLLGQHEATPTRLARAILDSLARAYAQAIAEAGDLCARPATVVHLVGGGSHNTLLCQLTADATGLPVIAGPVEASTLGNALVQAWALNRPAHPSAPTLHRDDLATMRALVARTQPLVRYEPHTTEGTHR